MSSATPASAQIPSLRRVGEEFEVQHPLVVHTEDKKIIEPERFLGVSHTLRARAHVNQCTLALHHRSPSSANKACEQHPRMRMHARTHQVAAPNFSSTITFNAWLITPYILPQTGQADRGGTLPQGDSRKRNNARVRVARAAQSVRNRL